MFNKNREFKTPYRLLVVAFFLFGAHVAHSSEFRAETGAERLERVREIIRAEQRRDPSQYNHRPENSTAPSCEVMLDDLMKGKGFSATLRQRDRLILRLLERHTGASYEGVRTDIEWAEPAPIPRDPAVRPMP